MRWRAQIFPPPIPSSKSSIGLTGLTLKVQVRGHQKPRDTEWANSLGNGTVPAWRSATRCQTYRDESLGKELQLTSARSLTHALAHSLSLCKLPSTECVSRRKHRGKGGAVGHDDLRKHEHETGASSTRWTMKEETGCSDSERKSFQIFVYFGRESRSLHASALKYNIVL